MYVRAPERVSDAPTLACAQEQRLLQLTRVLIWAVLPPSSCSSSRRVSSSSAHVQCRLSRSVGGSVFSAGARVHTQLHVRTSQSFSIVHLLPHQYFKFAVSVAALCDSLNDLLASGC